VFICYHHDDGDFADLLKSRIKAAGFDPWKAPESIRPGEEWRAEIDQAIKDAFALIVVMTPEAKASEYVTYEWAFALGARVRVIPVLLKTTKLHPRLEALQYLDFTNGTARPWDKLIEEVRQEANAQTPHTIRVPKDAPPAVKQAVAALDSVDFAERKAAVESLYAQMNHPAAREALASAVVQHSTLDVRVHASVMLAERRDARAVPGLIDAVRDQQYQYNYQSSSWWIHEFLQRIGPAAVPALIEALDKEDSRVRRYIIQTLGKIKDAAAVPALVDALRDEQVCNAAAEALERIGTPEAMAAVEQWRREQGAGYRTAQQPIE